MYKVGSHNSFGLNSGALEDDKCSPPKKRFYGPKHLCTLSASRRVIEHIKISRSPTAKEIGFTLLSPAGARSISTHRLILPHIIHGRQN